jgi:uncharacterized membrane protein YsdA (DUF1294 family)
MPDPASAKHPVKYHLVFATVLTAGGALALWLLLSQKFDWRHLLGCWLIAVNVVAFGYYGFDKSQAVAGAPRVPEVVLHGLTAAGGGLGAIAAMHLFRHKTLQGSFRFLFWCIVGLQLLLVAWVIKTMWFD